MQRRSALINTGRVAVSRRQTGLRKILPPRALALAGHRARVSLAASNEPGRGGRPAGEGLVGSHGHGREEADVRRQLTHLGLEPCWTARRPVNGKKSNPLTHTQI